MSNFCIEKLLSRGKPIAALWEIKCPPRIAKSHTAAPAFPKHAAGPFLA